MTDSLWFATLNDSERAELRPAGAALLKTPDVLIVGGGIVGLALAYYLAEDGCRVQLIDSEHLAAGATGANLGGVWPNDQGPSHPPAFQTLAFLGRDLWGRLSVRPEFDFDWRVNGFLNVNPEKFPPSAGEAAARMQNEGYAVTAVDGEQIARLEPHLRPGLTAGLHYPSEAHLHPVKAALSLARAARRKGARLATGVRAVSLAMNAHRVFGVETTAGRIDAGQVVSCTGWTAKWLGDAAAAPLPLRPVSGQAISTEAMPPLLNGAVGGKYLVLQLRSGHVVSGGTLLEGDSLIPDPQLSEQIADAARELIPALDGVPFTRAWCGLRPGTPDGLPILDRAPSAENLWIAAGHYRNGVLLAPACGKVLSEWILRGTSSLDLSPFRASRFVATAE